MRERLIKYLEEKELTKEFNVNQWDQKEPEPRQSDGFIGSHASQSRKKFFSKDKGRKKK
jgi:hypothetical protein